ncbi:ARM repeat-containing protein [Gonapodya prolifera JEL478]|uniref:ARM repeat-containing protein n=1 Tax=Gonapodya prolifera (strain JEL478) TaxID=1344416 RepID=A0A139ALZ5_GONPJ|nr:ARM repeat-containing protein [Gonapodya prolifera JEL478]|eukprot:KXS17792.1 ARM repeat-containing protein [Gonapodya prolifera JEL478]
MADYLLQLETLLKQVSSADTTKIRDATNTLKSDFFSRPECVPALTELASRSADPAIRQLAAVELRKHLAKQWPAVDPATQDGIRKHLLEHIVVEPNNLVRHALARAISAIAKLDLPDNKWPDLLPFLYQCCQSPNVAHREVGVYALYTLFETIADALQNEIKQMFVIFTHTINDPESKEVRVTTMQALGKVAEFVETDSTEDVKLFRDLIPPMVKVLQQCLEDGDEPSLKKGFEVLESLLLLDAPILSKHLGDLITFVCTVAGNTQYDDSLRLMPLNFLLLVIMYKKGKLQKLKLVQPMVAGILPIAAESDPDDADDDSPSRIALQIISQLATNLPPQQVFPVVMEQIGQYSQQPDPRFRKAAMMGFAVLVDGSADYMRAKVDELLPFIVRGLQDPEVLVRRAACIALGALAEELSEEVAVHHATLLPIVVSLADETNPDIQKQATNALDSMLEGMGDDIVQYLPQLMTKLVMILDTAPPEVKATVTGAIGSTAHAAGEAFRPYFDAVVPRLQAMMALRGVSPDGRPLEIEVSCRGVATDTIGAIADAVGKEAFAPYLEPFMKAAMEGLKMENHRLRECSYCFFATAAKLYEEEFSPFLAVVVAELLKSCKQTDTETEFADENGEIDLGDDDDEENGIVVNSHVAEEKEIAADALGELFVATQSHFMPYVEDSVNALIQLLDHYYPGVRRSAASSLFKFVSTFYKMSNPQPWVAGFPVQVPVHENVTNIAKLAMDRIVKMLEEEEDRMCVIQLGQDFAECLKIVGPILIDGFQEKLLAQILLILNRNHICQLDIDGEVNSAKDASPDEDEQAEYDALTISSASDMLGAMARATGPAFGQAMPTILPQIAKYYKPTRSSSDRSMAVGCMGEITDGLKNGVTPYAVAMLDLLVKALEDEEEDVRSNAIWATGLVLYNAESDLTQLYPLVLQKMQKLFDPESVTNQRDNACGALARMILKAPNAVPVDQALPILVGALPLKRDFEENEPVFQALFSLFRVNNSWVFQNVNQLLPVFQQVLAPPENQLKPPTRAELQELMKALGHA